MSATSGSLKWLWFCSTLYDVVHGDLAAVYRRLRVPASALAQLEDVRRLVRLRPRLGQIALERKHA
jgi:hypothetical protein